MIALGHVPPHALPIVAIGMSRGVEVKRGRGRRDAEGKGRDLSRLLPAAKLSTVERPSSRLSAQPPDRTPTPTGEPENSRGRHTLLSNGPPRRVSNTQRLTTLVHTPPHSRRRIVPDFVGV